MDEFQNFKSTYMDLFLFCILPLWEANVCACYSVDIVVLETREEGGGGGILPYLALTRTCSRARYGF